jgi:predicted  nucleic acid-binding Zn-ribbon protein
MGTNGMVERIQSLLTRFPEDEETVRDMATRSQRFDALCHEYRAIVGVLDSLEVQVRRLKQRRAWLEEELLTRLEGHQPH